MKIKLTVFLVLIGIFAPLANAADYYVSSTRSGRSDSNTGTNPDAPWATFGNVKSTWGSLQPGDTVHLERGSQWDLSFSSDYWYISKGGSVAGGSITLRGDEYGSGSKPILRRAGGSGDCCFILVPRSYVTIRDIEIDGGSLKTSGITIVADGQDVSNVQIKNMKIHNLGGSSSSYICGIWLTEFTLNSCSDCLIEGNEVSDYSAHGLNHYSGAPKNNIIWRNNYVHNNFTGGRFPSANSAMQIGGVSSGCIFEYNWLEDTTTTEGGLFAFGKHSGDTGVNTIRFNVIANSSTYGMVFTVDHYNMKLLYDIYGNIFMNNYRSGFALHPYNSYAAGTTFNIYNNLFYNNATGGDSSRGEMDIHNACDNVTIDFANNIIVHSNSSSGGLSVESGFSGSFSHRNNLYWHESGTLKNIISDGSTYTVATVKNYESTAQNTNPLFKNTAQLPTSILAATGPVPDGLSLQASSPAVGNGANLGSTYALDINQDARTVPWSIGAYQGGVSVEDTEPPSVSLSAPSGGATVSGSSITVSATASDDAGVIDIQFQLDGVDLGSEDPTAPYSIDWDTTDASNGMHSLMAVARDAAGNTAISASVFVSVDNTAPAVSITVPADGTTISGNSTVIFANASDNTGVAGVQFELDGADLGAEDTSSPYTVTWNTTGVTDGSHTLTAVARDADGNTTMSEDVTVTLDNAAPAVFVTAPSDGATVSGSSTVVSAAASDNIGVVGVQFQLDGVDLGSEDTTAPYSIAWDTTSTPNGSHTLIAVARDSAGNTDSSSITVAVDNFEIPADAIISEADTWQNQSFAAETVLFEVEFEAVPQSAVVDCVTGVAQGSAADYDDLAVIVRFNPNGQIDARNGDLYVADTSLNYTAGTSYRFRLLIDVAAHIYNVYVQIDGGLEILLADDYAFRTSQSTVTSLDTIAVTAAAGSHIVFNFTENQVVPSDTTAPFVSISTPSGGATLSGSSIIISASASDDTGVAGVQFILDGSNLGAEDTTSPFSVAWDTVGISNGDHTLSAVARDAAGNSTGSAAISVTVDNAPPTITLTNPSSGAMVSGSSITVSASASDDTGVAGVQFILDGSNLGVEDTASPFSVTWDTVGASNGDHTLSAVVRDAAGNSTGSAAISVTADNAPPTITLTTPSDGATVSGSSTVISAAAADNIGVVGIQFQLDGVDLGSDDTTAPYSIVWDTTGMPNGSHTLIAVARDSAGNTDSSSITVEVDNIEIPADAIISEADTWQNQSFAAETVLFEVEFEAVPQSAVVDCVTGVAQGSAADYDDLAVIVRFNPNGQIDARNGDLYVADTSLNYTAGTSYRFRLLIDVAVHTYSVYVQIDGGFEILLADDYAFRTSQSTVTSLDTIAVTAAAGSHIVFNFAQNQVSVAIPMPPTRLRIREN